MPAVVISDPPGISCTFSDGTGVTWHARQAVDRVLVCDLLSGLAGMVHPHGPVDAAKTVREYGFAIRAFARTLHGLGHRGPLAGLSRGRLTEALLGLEHRPEMMIRRVLSACDPRDAGPEVREVARAGRSAGSGPMSRLSLTVRASGSGCRRPAVRRPARRCPRSARPPGWLPRAGTRSGTAGQSRMCYGCWPAAAR